MKKNRQIKPLDLSNSRWLAYAAAGAATALGSAISAEAEIHYSGILNERFTGSRSTLDFPLTSGASLEFIRHTYFRTVYVTDQFAVVGAGKSWGYRGQPFSVAKLSRGVNVSSGGFFHFGDYPGTLASAFYGYGNFLEPGFGFVGFKFNGGEGTHYGWARLKFTGPPHHKFLLVDYAWADVGESILTGQKTSANTARYAIPDSGSLGLLALGGAGLMAWRKRRNKVATAEIP